LLILNIPHLRRETSHVGELPWSYVGKLPRWETSVEPTWGYFHVGELPCGRKHQVLLQVWKVKIC